MLQYLLPVALVAGIRAVAALVAGCWAAIRFEVRRSESIVSIIKATPPGGQVHEHRRDGTVLRIYMGPVACNERVPFVDPGLPAPVRDSQ